MWLSNAGPFWPFVCAVASVSILITLAVSKSKDRVARAWGWLILTWTWLYLPLWLTAPQIPQSSAVVSGNGRVYVVAEWARQPSDLVWLLTGRAGDRIVRNVAGTATVNSADVQYRYSEAYISSRSNEEDLSMPVTRAAGAILAEEAAKPRSSRIALFEKPDVHGNLLGRLCRTIAPNETRCPLKLSVSPQAEATLAGAVWSKFYTETEAIDERDLPTLVQLLTQDNSRLIDRDRVFALFIALASPEKLAVVALKSSLIDAGQFDELIARIIASPGCGQRSGGHPLQSEPPDGRAPSSPPRQGAPRGEPRGHRQQCRGVADIRCRHRTAHPAHARLLRAHPRSGSAELLRNSARDCRSRPSMRPSRRSSRQAPSMLSRR